MYTLRPTDDVDEIRRLHELALPGDKWVGDDHAFWILRDDAGEALGFCSAIHWVERNQVFLSRAAVASACRGAGLQRRMINVRLAWAMRQNAAEVVTYTTLKNYESMINLLRCGFRFYYPASMWCGNDVHYFKKVLCLTHARNAAAISSRTGRRRQASKDGCA